MSDLPRPLLLVLLALVWGLFAGNLAVSAAELPNLVVILCDDLGYGDLACYGHPHIKTPHLDGLAREGVLFRSFYASAPVCSPSRAGLLTGRTPYRAGIYDWIPSGNPMHLRREETTLASLLKDKGYATCLTGKWHCNGQFNQANQPQPGDHGFEHWFATQNNALPSHHNPKNFVRNGAEVPVREGYSSTLIVDEAIDWLQSRNAEKPFLLYVAFHSPHEPIATAEEFSAPYREVAVTPEEAEYFGNVSQLDHETGRLLAELDRQKLRDNTCVIFTSDNGPETLKRYRGAERSYGRPGSFRGMKLHLYEGGIRVPGIIRWPGHATAGMKSDEPVVNLDIVPTLARMAGTELSRTTDGADFRPALTGQPIKRASPLYWQYEKALGFGKIAIRDGDWKLLADAGMTKFELYNLVDDPTESRDLAGTEPQRLQELTARMQKMHTSVAADRPTWPQK